MHKPEQFDVKDTVFVRARLRTIRGISSYICYNLITDPYMLFGTVLHRFTASGVQGHAIASSDTAVHMHQRGHRLVGAYYVSE